MQRDAGKAKVAVVMGGSSAEREISIRSGSEVMRALHSLGYDARSLDYDDRFLDALRQRLRGGRHAQGTSASMQRTLPPPTRSMVPTGTLTH